VNFKDREKEDMDGIN